MPNFKFTSESFQREALRAEAATRFGRRIVTDADCIELTRAMSEDPSGGLSRATSRRFFLDEDDSFSRNTLDKLAGYASGCDFAYFCRLLAAGDSAHQAGPTEKVTPMALAGPTYAASLQQGYVLGMRTRPTAANETGGAQALAQATTPLGQKLFVESFVDLANLNGAYGAVVEKYLEYTGSWDKQIFGYGVLFLGAFLVQDKPLWQRRLAQLKAIPVPHGLHPFPLGRRTFALLMADWENRPAKPFPPSVLESLRQEARTCAVAEANAGYPTFYNYFPAGYHFQVAEALFLSGRYDNLTHWLTTTDEFLQRVAYQQNNNVFREVLEAFRAVAKLRSGAVAEATRLYQQLKPSTAVADNRWLWDYYQVYLWLTDLHFAVATENSRVDNAPVQSQIDDFAQKRNMPFFSQVARTIMSGH